MARNPRYQRHPRGLAVPIRDGVLANHDRLPRNGLKMMMLFEQAGQGGATEAM
jgi:hypothetical protein